MTPTAGEVPAEAEEFNAERGWPLNSSRRHALIVAQVIKLSQKLTDDDGCTETPKGTSVDVAPASIRSPGARLLDATERRSSRYGSGKNEQTKRRSDCF